MTAARKQSVGVMTKFSGSVKTAATSLIFKNRDPEFDHVLQFLNSFQKKVQAFGVLSDEIAKERFCELDLCFIHLVLICACMCVFSCMCVCTHATMSASLLQLSSISICRF